MLNNKATMQNTPIEQWPSPWLRMQCSGLLGNPGYMLWTGGEKRAAGYPVTDDEMRAFISRNGGQSPRK